MKQRFRHYLLSDSTKRRLFFLIAFWTTGVILGMLSSVFSDTSSLMLTVSLNRLSIVYHVLLLCVPLILSYILFRFFNFYLVLPIVFAKAFSYLCCGMHLRLAYDAAGWLLSALLLFTDGVVCCILLCFWCHQACNGKGLKKWVLACIVLLIFIGCIDNYIVSPFVKLLLNF